MRKPEIEMEAALEVPMGLRVVPRRVEGPSAGDASDEELLVRIGRRDREAFEVLYGRYVRPLLGLALRRLYDRERAEDAVQESFAAVWRSAASYRPERGAAGAWLYAVARNAVFDRLRARSEPACETPDTASAEPGPADRAEAASVAWRVHRALEDLGDGEREVIELAYWSEMSQREVAEHLQIPLGTVKTRTRSALARLAEILDGELT